MAAHPRPPASLSSARYLSAHPSISCPSRHRSPPRGTSSRLRASMLRNTSSSATPLFLVLSIILLFTLQPSIVESFEHRPQRRNYDTHAYYVLETHGGASSTEYAQELAQVFDTQFVERVGELDDFWLVRAPKQLVMRGYGLEFDNHSGRLRKRTITPELERRDAVIEYYDLLKRSIYSEQDLDEIETFDRSQRQKRSISQPRLSPRHAILSIRSLDRQVLRLRSKRDIIYIPSSDASKPIIKRDDVKTAAAQLPNTRAKAKIKPPTLSEIAAQKFNIHDPLWNKQWHLVNNKMPQHMINATGVWDMGYTGKNISVAIVDDGLDMTSDDLKNNFFALGSWDYNDHTPLPEPRLPDDLHGTRCAGEIAAERNDVCGVGVAFDAKVAGIRILSASISDADEASALNFGYQHNHIYSCSWGPPDDGKSMEAPSRLIFKAMLNGIQKGRNGKGSVFVFASGNGGAVDDQCNFDGYTNSIYSVTISAIDREGKHPYYSEVCSANMVVTYSSGSGDNIHTTDVGKNKCTDRHGGTSAAAPLGAGIFALVLEARPDLTWRDVQYLAVTTAIPFNMDDSDWQKTATGRWYNHKFGFGNMDAYKIVEAAQTWKLVKPQAWWKSPNVNANSAPITKAGANATIEVKQSDLDRANFETLEHITVAVNILHGRRGNVRVLLISPHGTVSILAAHRRFDEATTGFPGWVFMTVKHWGENAVGNWTLSVQDPHGTPGKNGTFEDWAMGMWGECKNPSDQRLFKMPDDADIHLPPSPLSATIAATPTAVTNPPPLVSDVGMFTKTKLLAKPTAHLPSNHTGSAAEDFLTGVGDLSNYLKGKSTWLYVGFGTMIVIGGCLSGWLILLRIRRKREHLRLRAGLDDDEDDQHEQGVGLLSGAKRVGLLEKMMGAGKTRNPNSYSFEPVGGEEDMPMRSMDRSGDLMGRLGPKRTRGPRGTTTKDLYDAFGDGSESDDESGRSDFRAPEQTRTYSDIKPDDKYMDSFLEDDSNEQPDQNDENDDNEVANTREESKDEDLVKVDDV